MLIHKEVKKYFSKYYQVKFMGWHLFTDGPSLEIIAAILTVFFPSPKKLCYIHTYVRTLVCVCVWDQQKMYRTTITSEKYHLTAFFNPFYNYILNNKFVKFSTKSRPYICSGQSMKSTLLPSQQLQLSWK